MVRPYRDLHPVSARLMAEACRRLAADLRREAAVGWGDVRLTGKAWSQPISRREAAERMDEQAARWEAEAGGGPRNAFDRARIGEP